MAKPTKILRRSIHAFFQNYQSFATTATLLTFPFSASLLLSQSFIPSSTPLLQTLSSRLHALFQAAGFPFASQFFSFLNLKLSQAIFSFLFTLPFTLTFFVLAKSATIQLTMLRISVPSFPSLLHLCRLILPTLLFNSFVILSSNAAIFSLMFLAINTLEIFHLSSENSILVLSAISAVLYSIVIANTMVACSLSLIISAMENCRGYLPILKACVLVQGKEATAITLALPASLGMAAIEALFQYRVGRSYLGLGKFSLPVVGEAFLIAYIYSLLIVIDTVVSCKLYRSLKSRGQGRWETRDHQILPVIQERKGNLQARSFENLHYYS